MTSTPPKPRLCFVAPKAYPLFSRDVYSGQSFGGANVQLYLLGTEVARQEKYDVHFLVADYGQPAQERREGITIHRGFSFEQSKIISLIRFFRTLYAIDADVYIGRALDIGMGIVGLFCKLFGKRYVYMVAHDREVDLSFEKEHGRSISCISNSVFRWADVIVTQSGYQQELLQKNKGRKSVILPSGHVIPSGNVLLNKKGKTILWVGRSEPWKQPECFLKLARRLPQYRYIMVCTVATGQAAYHAALRKQAQMIPHLTWIDYVPFQDIDELFQEASLVVNTSEKGGFPNTYVQAAKYRGLFLALAVDPDTIFSREGVGVTCGNDFELFVQKVDDFFINPATYDMIRQRAYSYVVGRHDIKQVARQFISLL